MQIIHRVSLASTPDISAELATMGVVVASNGLVTFEIDESHESWSRIQRWIVVRSAVDIVHTKFSEAEILEAEWLELVPEWHHGYPQPNEDLFGYRPVTFETTEFCEECGIGLKQIAPFRMKAEPKWGRRGILQLNWVFDEYFVTPEVSAKVFAPHEVGSRKVLNTAGRELSTVVQLVVENEIDIFTDGLTVEKCTECGRVKYRHVKRGYFPALAGSPTGHIMKTRQYFGSGASAARPVCISQKLARALQQQAVRGASMRPVERRRTRSNSRGTKRASTRA